jgi:phage shock protein A
MNLLERVLTLLRANLNSVVENADDPERTLRRLQIDMRNQLVQVKTQVATALAQGHSLRLRSREKQGEAEKCLNEAEKYVQQDNDEAARLALARYNEIMKQAERYRQLQQEQEQLVVTMRTALHQLEAKIAEVETTIELLAMRKRNAIAQQRVYDALNETGRQKNQEQVARAQDAVLEAEARARALADLHQRDMNTQLEEVSEEQVVEQQLRNLKEKKRTPEPPRLLQEGNAQPSPLLQPQPRSGEPVRKREPQPAEAGTPPPEVSPSEKKENERLQKLLDAIARARNKD